MRCRATGSDARAGSRGVQRLGGLEPEGVWAIGFDRSMFHYKSRRADSVAVEMPIKEICETRVRYALPPGSFHSGLRGLGHQHQESLSHLQGVGHAAEEQDAETAGEGQAAR